MITALERGVPLRRVSASLRLYQFGQRCYQKRIWRGFTSQTSQFGTVAAKRKAVANEMLRSAGLPVAMQRTVRDAAAAMQAAVEVGFPVVVKPASKDSGTAVSPDVRNEADLLFAFRSARRHGAVLVEDVYREPITG